MSRRATRIVLSAVVGSIGVAIGLYFGRFIAGGVGVLFASSRGALPFATSIAWWAFIGLVGGAGLAVVAIGHRRIGFVAAALAGFALGGALAAVPEASRLDRDAALAVLATPAGGALAGLLMGLSARLKTGVVLMIVAGALAMWIAQPFFDLLPPRSILDAILSVLVGSGSSTSASSDAGAVALNTLLLFAPGALIGIALAALKPAMRPNDEHRSISS
jgi:hypothetical protein